MQSQQAVSNLPQDQVTADLNAVADYVIKLPAANGKLAVAGFCWGGSQAFNFATTRARFGIGVRFSMALRPIPKRRWQKSRHRSMAFMLETTPA